MGEKYLYFKFILIFRTYSLLPQPNYTHHKPLRLSTMQVQENIDSMFELMPFRSKWAPVDHFIQLGGVTKCFQVIGKKCDSI